MQHGRSPYTGADVGRASCEVSKLIVKGKVKRHFQLAICLVNHVEYFSQLEARANGLHAQMVFFVDHETEGLSGIHHNSTSRSFGRMLPTDKVTLYQNLFFQ